jgi:hypothetical protein
VVINIRAAMDLHIDRRANKHLAFRSRFTSFQINTVPGRSPRCWQGLRDPPRFVIVIHRSTDHPRPKLSRPAPKIHHRAALNTHPLNARSSSPSISTANNNASSPSVNNTLRRHRHWRRLRWSRFRTTRKFPLRRQSRSHREKRETRRNLCISLL